MMEYEDRFRYRLWNKIIKEYDEQFYLMVYNDGTVRCIEDSSWYLDCSDDYIIEQCTGLKDKNGKLIYEGDIVAVEYYNGKLSRPSVVRYGKFNCSCCNGVYGWYFKEGDIREVEEYIVIGNIHENGNLIEGEK